jgi:TRAP transporter TAXI family solute receptor
MSRVGISRVWAIIGIVVIVAAVVLASTLVPSMVASQVTVTVPITVKETVKETVTIGAATVTVTVTKEVTPATTVTSVATTTPTPAKPWPTVITIATCPVGGSMYISGGGVASVISKYVGVNAVAEVTEGGEANILLVKEGKHHIGYTTISSFLTAVKEKGFPLKVLMVPYIAYSHIVTTEESGIKSIYDIRGKRVNIGQPGGITMSVAYDIFEAAGLVPDRDFKVFNYPVGTASADALKDGKIDVYFQTAGLPLGPVIDLATTPGIKLVLVDHGELIDKLAAKGYVRVPIPKGTYPGIDRDVDVLAIPYVLFVRDDFPEDLAYKIVDALITHKDELVAVMKGHEYISLENAIKGIPKEVLHPGVIKYFTEKGILK